MFDAMAWKTSSSCTPPLAKGPLEPYLDLGLCIAADSSISKTKVGYSGSCGAYTNDCEKDKGAGCRATSVHAVGCTSLLKPSIYTPRPEVNPESCNSSVHPKSQRVFFIYYELHHSCQGSFILQDSAKLCKRTALAKIQSGRHKIGHFRPIWAFAAIYLLRYKVVL